MSEQKEDWDLVVKPKQSILSIDLRSLWHYRDLLLLFVKRVFVAGYKQTILGPLWYIIQPVLMAITFSIIFSNLAKMSTGGLPPFVFYLSGITIWNFFAECLNKTSNTFISNANIFGKVYFPRLVVPVSIILSNLITFLIQFGFFMVILGYHYFRTGSVHPNRYMLLLPVLIFIM